MTGGIILAIVILLASLLMFNQSKIFRFYAKFLLFAVISSISATVFIPVMFLKPKDYRNALLPAWCARQCSRLLGIRWEMRGHNNIVQNQGTIVVINHQSCLDLLVLAEIWPVLQRCTVISKREIFFWWPFGLAAWLWGTVFIKRGTKDNKKTIRKVSTTIHSKQAKICMFPEGTRHGGDELLPFKKGAFHIAIGSQAPIQPLVVSRYNFLDCKTYKFEPGNQVISILPAIETRGRTKEDIEDVIRTTYTAMSEEYQRLNNEPS